MWVISIVFAFLIAFADTKKHTECVHISLCISQRKKGEREEVEKEKKEEKEEFRKEEKQIKEKTRLKNWLGVFIYNNSGKI